MRESALHIYAAITRLSPLRHFRANVLLLALLGYLIPIITGLYVAFRIAGWTGAELPREVWLMVGIVMLLGLTGWLYALYQLLAPVVMAQQALQDYLERNQTPNLPTHLMRDEAGQMLAHTQNLISQFDQAMRYLANYDKLTGLPNRAAFEDRLRQAMAQVRRNGQTLAVLMLDLSGFRMINNSLGQRNGDYLLKAVAERLNSHVRETDGLSRLGDDKFALLQTEMHSLDHLMAQVQRLLEALRHPFSITGREVQVGLNIGIALYPADAKTYDQLLSNAGAALTLAKSRGRYTYQFYASGLNERLQRKLELENDLRHACRRGEIQVYYQPQVEMGTGRIIGLEALLRWHHARLGLIDPAEFIALAEEIGYIIELGEWALQRACEQWAAWRKAGLAPVKLALNLSARQLHQPGLVETIAETLRKVNMDPKWLELEVTESSLVEDLPQAQYILSALQQLGVSIALDDFGSGYSSLNYLRRLPISTLKVDREFIKDLPSDMEGTRMLRGIQALARTIGLEVLVEGVETEAQLQCLQLLGCERAQGFLLSRPVTADVLTARLIKGKFGSLFDRLKTLPLSPASGLILS